MTTNAMKKPAMYTCGPSVKDFRFYLHFNPDGYNRAGIISISAALADMFAEFHEKGGNERIVYRIETSSPLTIPGSAAAVPLDIVHWLLAQQQKGSIGAGRPLRTDGSPNVFLVGGDASLMVAYYRQVQDSFRGWHLDYYRGGVDCPVLPEGTPFFYV